jgi:hypothetical protein
MSSEFSTAGPERWLARPIDEVLGFMSQKQLDQQQKLMWILELARWEVMATFTFKWETSLDWTRSVYSKWIRKRLPGISWFYALERNPSRDGYHVHSLWADCQSIYRKAIWQEVTERWGYARIEPVRSCTDSAGYAAKYLCKEDGWYDIKLQWHRMKKLHEQPFALS